MNIDTSVVGITIPQGAAKNIKRSTEMLWQDGGLPTAFQRCEYIESVSGVRMAILTGVQTATDLRVVFDYKIIKMRQWGFLFGYNPGVSGSTGYGVQETGDNTLQLFFCRNDYSDRYRSNFGTRHLLDYNTEGHKFFEDGVFIKNIQPIENFTPSILVLFSRSVDLDAQYELYGCRLYEHFTELVRDFIPCYLKTAWNGIPAGTIGLYDLCGSLSSNGTPFYTNDGTGAFTKGPDVT